MEKERTGELEVEGIPSKGLSLYDQSQQKFGEFLNKNVSIIKCVKYLNLGLQCLIFKYLASAVFAHEEIKLYNQFTNVNIIVFKLV